MLSLLPLLPPLLSKVSYAALLPVNQADLVGALQLQCNL